MFNNNIGLSLGWWVRILGKRGGKAVLASWETSPQLKVPQETYVVASLL